MTLVTEYLAPMTFWSQLLAAPSTMEAFNFANLVLMSTFFLGWARSSNRGGSWRLDGSWPLPNVPSSPTLLVCLRGLSYNLPAIWSNSPPGGDQCTTLLLSSPGCLMIWPLRWLITLFHQPHSNMVIDMANCIAVPKKNSGIPWWNLFQHATQELQECPMMALSKSGVYCFITFYRSPVF